MNLPSRELFIDGAIYVVPQRVWAHFKFQNDLIERLATRCETLAPHLAGETSIRWTSAHKEAVVARARISAEERARVIRSFDLSDEELDGWIAAYDAEGHAGLMATRRAQG